MKSIRFLSKRDKEKRHTAENLAKGSCRKVGLNASDANNRSIWRLGVNTISS